VARNNSLPFAKSADTRSQLGRLFRDLVMAGLQQKGDVEEWWAQCERYHRNEPAPEEEDTKLVPVRMPYSQPRQDSLSAQVCSALTRSTPMMVAETADGDDVENRLETAIHRFWRAAGFERQIRRASSICTDTNRVWWRVAWEHNPRKVYGGIIIDVFHPKHVCIFPATVEGIENARLVGHRFYRRLREIETLQKAGKYFNDVSISAGDSPQTTDTTGEIDNSGAAPDVSGPDPRDLRVELWEVLVRYSPQAQNGEDTGPEKWYRATISYAQGALLSIEEYPYSRPWYFDSSYIIGNEDAYWSGISVARNLSLLQDATDKIFTGFYNGMMAGSYPPVFGPQGPEKDFRYGFGEYIPVDAPANMFFSPQSRFTPQGFMQALEIIDETGDKTARVSANTMGAAQASAKTATENDIIAAGVAVGIEEYIGNFSYSLGDMAGFTQELLGLHFSEWSAMYAQKLELAQADFKTPALWEPNGKSPGNSPGARLAAVDRLAGLAKAFGPASGIDPYELTRMAVSNLGLEASEQILIKKEQMLANAQANAASNSGNPPQPGMGGGPALPPGGDLNGPGAMPAVGPAGQPNGIGP
jgi:hypothetical protein